MDDVAWVIGFYPVLITMYTILCQSQLHIPRDVHRNPSSNPFEAGTRSIPADKIKVIVQEQKDIPDDYVRLESEHQKPSAVVKSRISIWIAAFWLALQLYCLIRMGNKIGPAEQQCAGFIWIATISLCLPTFVSIQSVGKLYEALENVESYQRSSIESKQEYFLTSFGVSTALLLVLIPWFQAVLVLIRS